MAPTQKVDAEPKAPPNTAERYPTFAEMNTQAAPGYASVLPPLDTKVVDVYAQLHERAAQGDGRAACRLAIELQQCADRDFMLQGADRAAQMLQQSGQQPRDAGGAAGWGQRRLEVAQQQIDYALALDERCDGVTETQLVEHADLWRRAALTGHVPSMVHYARGDGFRMRATLDSLDRLAQYKGEAERIMRSAAAAGSVEAAQQLAHAYQETRGPWASLLQQAVKPNPFEALTLHELAELRDYPPIADPREAERWNRNSAFVDGEGFRFDHSQLAQAKARAQEIDKLWAHADDSAGNRRSPWERADHAREACDRDRFITPP